jgi:hypothetical protein
MHLEKAYLTTTRYTNKQKPSKSKKLAKAKQEHEDWLKKIGVGKTQLPVDKKGRRIGLYDIPDYKTGPRMTSDRVAANGAKKDTPRYTGTEIAGYVVTHKSNLMPIRRDNLQAAKDAATMRRS